MPAQTSVGIVISAQHRWLMGMFSSPVVFGERNVMQFEPLPSEQCLPGKHS